MSILKNKKSSFTAIIFIVILLMLLPCVNVFSEENVKINLDKYYYYPISAGIYYNQMSSIGNNSLPDFSVNQIYGEIRVPIPGVPEIQPLLRGGYIGYNFTGDIDDYNQDWSHFHIFGALGASYTKRISREFEVGGEIFGGFSQSYFTELVLNGTEVDAGEKNLLAGASGRLALNPSFNFSISVEPVLNYLYGLGNLHTYDSFTLGIGFSATYRVGDDPDSSRSTIKAIRFEKLSFPPLFAAMQSYYVNNPAGTITLTNKERYDLNDVDLTFMQPGFMDSPSPVASSLSIKAGESIEVPVPLTFNNEVFSTQGTSPLTGELIANYTVRGRAVEQRQSVTYELHDKNALTWNDDRKAAAFITSQDSAIRNYSSHIRQIHRDLVKPYLSSNLQFAMQVFNALGEIGILYQIDPTAPFTEMQGDTLVVDSISLPRETLKRLTGDCDDLTVLFCTMLESIGIDSAFITVPGHIFCAFNTGVASSDYRMLNPDRNRIIELDGEIWVPVEITMIGRTSFTEAWSKGYAEYSECDLNPNSRGFYRTKDAQSIFRPVVLRETDLGLQYGDDSAVVVAFKKDLDSLSDSILKPVRQEAENKNDPSAWNSYGITAAKFGAYNTAAEAFSKAITKKSDFTGARLNLGSLYYLTEDYNKALNVYKDIVENKTSSHLSSRTLFNLYLNMSKTSYALEKADEANEYYSRATELNANAAASYSYLKTGGGAARASAAEDEKIMFFEE